MVLYTENTWTAQCMCCYFPLCLGMTMSFKQRKINQIKNKSEPQHIYIWLQSYILSSISLEVFEIKQAPGKTHCYIPQNILIGLNKEQLAPYMYLLSSSTFVP